MICDPCQKKKHPRCQSVNCCCRHQGSGVRPLTQDERHQHMVGDPLPTVLPDEVAIP